MDVAEAYNRRFQMEPAKAATYCINAEKPARLDADRHAAVVDRGADFGYNYQCSFALIIDG